MSKYDIIPITPHKARVEHSCYGCGKQVKVGEKIYYQNDKFLQSLSKKKFCETCAKTNKKDKNQRILK